MIFRKLSANDFEQVRGLLESFHKEFLEGFDFKFVEVVYENLTRSVLFNTTWVMVDEDKGVVGVLAGSMTEYLLSGEPMFHEHVWYIDPESRSAMQGDKFYKYCEEEVKKLGAKKMVMIHIANDMGEKVGRYYQHLGYKPLESYYIKNLET